MNAQNRPSAVAGTFYPGEPGQLEKEVRTLLAAVPPQTDLPETKALIAPHAGYIYSGQTAAYAYAPLTRQAEKIKRVVLLGPSHRVGFLGMALPSCVAFETPLGEIPLDTQTMSTLERFPQVCQRDDAHAWEHSLEVQLPFLQCVLKDFSLIPIVVGECDAGLVAEVLDSLWGDEDTLIIVSTDMSHFHRYEDAKQIDQETNQRILALNTRLVGEQACGCKPLNGLLQLAQEKTLKISLLDMRNSGDTAGDKERVVGYSAYALH